LNKITFWASFLAHFNFALPVILLGILRIHLLLLVGKTGLLEAIAGLIKRPSLAQLATKRIAWTRINVVKEVATTERKLTF
jgi:hypothetical protein